MMSVLQPWVENLTLKQQTQLLAVVRGPDDGCAVAKELTRRARHAFLVAADKKASYTSDALLHDLDLGKLEYKSQHLTSHLRKAARRIAEGHPDEAIREYWKYVGEELDGLLK